MCTREPLVRINLDPQIRSTAKPITFREDNCLARSAACFDPSSRDGKTEPTFSLVLVGWRASLGGGEARAELQLISDFTTLGLVPRDVIHRMLYCYDSLGRVGLSVEVKSQVFGE